MLAQDVMTRDPITLRADASLADAIDIFQTRDIRHLPIVDEGGNLVGMLSDRDIRDALAPIHVGEDAKPRLSMRIASLMSGGVISVEEDDDVEEIIDLMLEHKVGAVPIVSGDGDLVGIVSYLDLLRVMESMLSA